MADATRIFDLAEALLSGIETAADGLGIDLPSRRFIAEGEVAWDCPLVAVAVPRIYRGRPLAEAQDVNRRFDTFVVEYDVWILREVPRPSDNGKLPTPTQITASAKTIMTDGFLITVGLRSTVRTLDGLCTSAAATQTFAQGPDGGLGGWQSTIEVAL